MALSILGTGTVSALGGNIGEFRAGLAGNKKPFVENEKIDLENGVVSLPVYKADTSGLQNFMPQRALRRIDSFTRMALLASFGALKDSGLDLKDMGRTGIIFGSAFGPLNTTFGFQDSLINDGDKCASPLSFAGSVHNSPAAQVSIQLGIDGPVQTLSAFNHTVSGVLELARSWIENGIADTVIAGAGDEYCPVRGYSTALTLNGIVPSEIKPLFFDKCSYLPGEGFAVFILADGKKSSKYGVLKKMSGRAGIDETNLILKDDKNIKALFLSANGDSREGKTYAKINTGNIPVRAYSHLYGAFPCGTVLSIAAGLLSAEKPVLCIEHSEDDELNLYEIGEK